MKSMRFNNSLENPQLIEHDTPKPVPQPEEVLIRVCAAGITTTELAWTPTSQTKSGTKRLNAVPSHEFSGEIADLGEAVRGLSIGQQVYGMNDWFDDGALAEYCLTRPTWIAPKPRSLDHAKAASVPIGALTAWQGLFTRAKLQAGERVLIHGGAGAVGVFAIQLARFHGAHVITTVSAQNASFVKDLGAAETIDYRSVPFESVARDIDVVFDAVGGETRERSWGVLKPHGRLVTIASDGEDSFDARTKQAFFIVEPNREQLLAFAKMIDAGELRVFVDRAVPLSRASDAYTGKIEKTGRGKLVVVVGRQQANRRMDESARLATQAAYEPSHNGA